MIDSCNLPAYFTRVSCPPMEIPREISLFVKLDVYEEGGSVNSKASIFTPFLPTVLLDNQLKDKSLK